MTTQAIQTEPKPKHPALQLATFEPQNVGEMMALAQMLAQSSLVPTALRGKPGDIVIVALTGRDFGLSMMQSLRMIHVIEGKPVLAADLIVGLCLQAPECEYFRLVESTEEQATYETRRKGSPKPVQITYTMQDAQAAGLANKDNWRKNRRDMLRRRAASRLGRDCYPDRVGGMYDPDEAEEIRETAARAAEVVDDGRPKRPSTPEELKAALRAELGEQATPLSTEPAAEADLEPDPFADPEPETPAEAATEKPLDPADHLAFSHRRRTEGLPPQSWDAWSVEKVWPKGMLAAWTPAEVIQGSHKGKRHAALRTAVEWGVRNNGQATMPLAVIYADYCLAFLEEKWAREGQTT